MENQLPPSARLLLYQLFLRNSGCLPAEQVPGGNWSQNRSGTLGDINDEFLSSIRDLGFNALWITGLLRHASQSDNPGWKGQQAHPSLVKGMAGSPYAIEDFFATCPDLHKNPEQPFEELDECLRRIHRFGMKAIMDFVPNHCARSYQSPFARSAGLRDLGEGDFTDQEFHPQNHFYYLPGQNFVTPGLNGSKDDSGYHEFPARATGNDCFQAAPSVNDWYETVKLNYGIDYRTGEKHFFPEPPVWKYMEAVLLFWAGKGIDGFRCDMAEMVPSEFWAKAIPAVKSAFPGCLFIAEIYQPWRYQEYLAAGFDFIYDKAGMYDVLRGILEGRKSCHELTGVWQQQEGIGKRMLRFLENHDEQRMASGFAAGNGFHALPAFAITAFSSHSALMLYAGQELGEKAEGAEGFSGDDGRSSIFDYAAVPTLRRWFEELRSGTPGLFKEEQELRLEYRKILRLAAGCPALYSGHFFDLQYINPDSAHYFPERMYTFLRYDDEHKLLISASFSGEDAEIQVCIPVAAWEAMNFPPEGAATLHSFPEGDFICDFSIEKSLVNNHSNEGIRFRMPGRSYRIFRIELQSSEP